jgi:hypothetical protein
MKTILVVMKSLFKGVSSDFMNIFQFQSLLGQNELSKEVRVGGYFRHIGLEEIYVLIRALVGSLRNSSIDDWDHV